MVHLNLMHCRYVLLLLFLTKITEAGFLASKLSTIKELRKEQLVITVPMSSNSSKRPELQIERKYRYHPNASSQPYYLLNSIETWKSILLYSSMLFVLQKASSSFTAVPFLCKLPCILKASKFQHLWSYSLPLLSSSCCAIQLALNAIAGIGCAGFNTTLGPLRPFFVSVMMITTITSFSAHRQMYQVILSWAVALMPEFLHLINSRSATKELSCEESSKFPNKNVIELDIEGMGCVACINKIDRTLKHSDHNIIEASSWLNEDTKGGKAKVVVRYNDEQNLDKIVNDIVSCIEDAGFTATAVISTPDA